jgi:hypothetical protein
MTTRWLTRIMGGMAGLALSTALVLTIADSGILNGKRDAVLAAACPHSCNCRSDQVCCTTANGGCGCFPSSIRC